MKLNLPRIFGEAAFRTGAAVFPEIDEQVLAREMGLEALGKSRGDQGLPRADASGLDATEQAVIDRIGTLRRAGLQSYEEHRDVYRRRVSEAPAAMMAVEGASERAQGDFEKVVKEMRGQMARPVAEMEDWSKEIRAFKQEHGLRRPAYEAPHPAMIGVVLLVCVLIETVLNGYLFAQKNELGLLGGAFVAALVAIVNVAVASFLGIFARIVTHRALIIQLAGLSLIALFAAWSFGFNLVVAHFRDAVARLDGWSAAAEAALIRLEDAPIGLASVESWLTLVWGGVVGFLAFYKFFRWGEPYPGYAKRARAQADAIDYYADQHAYALDVLAAKRDDLVDDLIEHGQSVRRAIADAAAALQGQSTMRAHLEIFLQGCDDKATLLLKLYRDANISARSDAPPDHFAQPYRFPAFSSDPLSRKELAETERRLQRLDEVLEGSMGSIHSAFMRLKEEYPDVDEVMRREGAETVGARVPLDFRPRQVA